MEDKIKQDITDYGWTILAVEETDYLPSFAFTLGLWQEYKHPELISFGLPVQTLHNILNLAGELVKSGKTLQPGTQYDDFFEQSEASFLPVDPANLSDYFAYALNYYGEEQIPALQLVWQDRNGRYPWEALYEKEFQYRQPLLDRNMDFKFSESPELAVITSKQFLEQGAPVLRVIHTADGSWQFLSSDSIDAADTMLVSLQQVIQADPSLNQFFNLDLGERASRSNADESWQRDLF